MTDVQILYPDNFSPDVESGEKSINGHKVTITAYGARNADDIPHEVWQSAQGLITGIGMAIDDKVFDRAPACRIVTRMGVGVDIIDVDAASRRGIAVCNVPDYGTNEVSDHAIALLLSFTRGIVRYNDAFRDDPEDGWHYLHSPTTVRMCGKTFGVIGLGRIGTASAMRAKAFGMNVIFYDPYVPDGQDLALGITRAETLADLLGSADFVTIHAPLTLETRNLINHDAVAAMKPGLILINTARGPIVDLDAVHDGLEEGQLGAAGLDVLPAEPPPADNRLIQAWRQRAPWLEGRLVITPHAAFYSQVGITFMRDKALSTSVDYIATGRLRNCVNQSALATR